MRSVVFCLFLLVLAAIFVGGCARTPPTEVSKNGKPALVDDEVARLEKSIEDRMDFLEQQNRKIAKLGPEGLALMLIQAKPVLEDIRARIERLPPERQEIYFEKVKTRFKVEYQR